MQSELLLVESGRVVGVAEEQRILDQGGRPWPVLESGMVREELMREDEEEVGRGHDRSRSLIGAGLRLEPTRIGRWT
jgi:hypothetical protein